MTTNCVQHEDERELARYLEKDAGGVGFFGYGWYLRQAGKVRLVPIVKRNGELVELSEASITDGSYPFSRPLFLYSSRQAAARKDIAAFIKFYLEHAAAVAAAKKQVPLPAVVYERLEERFDKQGLGARIDPGLGGGHGLAELSQRGGGGK
jgi:phosphate transport system substrate-binding protein